MMDYVFDPFRGDSIARLGCSPVDGSRIPAVAKWLGCAFGLVA
jgi:hypothetical protein